MGVKEVLKKIDFSVPSDDLSSAKTLVKEIAGQIKEIIKKNKLKADIFIGGSFAKGTLVKSTEYDIDLFLRFDKSVKDISAASKKIVRANEFSKWNVEELKGSRNYFRVRKDNLFVEIIPVRKIRKAKEAENITDLSYFHVSYLKKKINKKLIREISLAKTFAKAQKIYGAESYINGFSGYALECLIIYYKSFEKMLNAFSKSQDKIIIDPEKYYKNKSQILLELNESRAKSPIILIDPTWKERNVLAALNQESFEKFKLAAKNFLHKPSEKFFEEREIDLNKMRKSAKEEKNEFLEIIIETQKQEGDIAGTKLKKFSKFVINELSKYFDVKKYAFLYEGKKDAKICLVLNSKRKVERKGPPLFMKDNCHAFKEEHKETYEKNGSLYSMEYINFSAAEYVDKFYKKNRDKIKEMDIISLRVNSS